MPYRKSLTVVLILMLFLIMGSMHRTYASHITEHTHHHTSAMHSTAICSWMCAAAQTISGDNQEISPSFQLLAIMEYPIPKVPTLISTHFLPTRAPPR
ncbi:MAG TPA: hypothetical protein PKM72_04115 [Nitrospirales bacterium]|nr:hypothetical protein [Nitrospira sp. MA-1]HNP60001.1 hypothetical protein [Nitrospirales bacterium]